VNVAEAVGRALAALDVRMVFGVVGSGNFHATNALVAGGARFVPARHECGAVTMADAYAQVSGTLGVASVHQGPGLTNALTGLAEAAKSRTPLLVLAGEPAGSAVLSNFRVDQAALAAAVEAVPERIHSPASAMADLARACRRAVAERRTVLVNMPLDVQAADHPWPATVPPPAPARPPRPGDAALAALAEALGSAVRPVFVAGRGARAAGPELVALAEACGALLATSAVARGLFRGDPFDLDISGGFATPLAAEAVAAADLLVGWGASLNMWTLRQGELVGPGTTVVQVDTDPAALGAKTRVDLGVVGDVAATARALLPAVTPRTGYRTAKMAERVASEGRWRMVPYEESSDPNVIDPRTLSIALDDLLPAERTVAVDSGNFMGYPAVYLEVPGVDGLVFTQAYQSVGLGLATAIGAALARPERLTVAALGDGGALMSAAELDTAVRLRLGMLIVVYDDEAYGAEVHHFGPGGHPLDTVRFPPTDIAAIGRGYGCAAATVRTRDDLSVVAGWLAGPRDRPLLLDAKVSADLPSWWLQEAFRGH
jgi:thiamine pyrophosphate-dependent acetolactate synthase large subunit-like protein